MTHHVITVDPDTSLQAIANLFEQHGIKRVPVVKDGQLVGIVSRANLVQALAIHGLPFFDRLEADETLRAAVMSKIHKLHGTGSMIDIMVDHGIVTLWGVVRTEEEKNSLRAAAEETHGVLKVNNHLRISRTKPTCITFGMTARLLSCWRRSPLFAKAPSCARGEPSKRRCTAGAHTTRRAARCATESRLPP